SLVGRGFCGWQSHRRELAGPAVRQTIATRHLARTIKAAAGALPLTYVVETPFAMQLELNTMRPMVSVDDAAALLRGDTAAFVVTAHLPRLRKALGTGGAPRPPVPRAGRRGGPPPPGGETGPAASAPAPPAARGRA